jgi:hypothetical protein
MTMKIFFKSILTALFAIPAAAWAEDLSMYRSFQLGTDLPTIAKQAGVDPAQARVVHRRPALIQELAWRPQFTGPSGITDTAKDVVFSFYDGRLYRITVGYDRYQIDGLTVDDLVDAISTRYGGATRSGVAAGATSANYAEHEEVLAQWQDPQYDFSLVRSSYGRDFKLVGTLRDLNAQAAAAEIEAVKLDLEDAPQREAARVAKEDETERVRLEKARLANKAKFRP